jgi:hypothetical protein
MYTALIHTHSLLRYVVLALLIAVIIKSLLGWLQGKDFSKADDKLSLFLLIGTHTQLLVGLFLYFVSPVVQFSAQTMKDRTLRFWTVEHIFIMVLAVILITVARISHKKLATASAKHKRLFLLNVLALILIVMGIVMSGRGLIVPTRGF